MAFPAIAATATTLGSTAGTSVSVNLPAGIASGDLLIVVHRNAAGGTIGWPAGWTEVFENISDASNDTTAWAYRVADGTEGATITVTQGTSGKFASLAWRITGHDSAIAPQSGTINIGTDINPTPGPTTPTGGAKDYLWLAVGGWEGEQLSPPGAFPANYTLNQIAADSGTGGAVATNCRVAGAGRQLNAASESPGAYSISVSDDWTAWTIAVHPVVATTNRRGQVSFSEMEAPLAPRRGQVSFAELEAPSAPRRGLVSFSEFEAPTAPRRGRVSFSEFEAPSAPRRGRLSFTEFEVSSGPRRGIISFAEMELPSASGWSTLYAQTLLHVG